MENQKKVDSYIEVSASNMHLGPDSLVVYHPRYIDAAKTKIKAIVRTQDGKLVEMEASKSDSSAGLIRDIFCQYSEPELEMFTHRENCILQKLHDLNQRMQEDKKITDQREELFQAKSMALALPAIKDHADKELKHKIRKANSTFEVMAIVVTSMVQNQIPQTAGGERQ